MTPLQFEMSVLSYIDRVVSSQPVEDTRFECKAEWPEKIDKAARQIAGHANAARGEPVIWLIGVDEKAHRVTGASAVELADWLPQLKSKFDGIAPNLAISINVPYQDKTVVALYFETDRAPFVVKTGQDAFSHELPWREGTRVRSARREDVLRLLTKQVSLPEIEVRSITFELDIPEAPHPTTLRHRIELYVTPRTPEPVYIPFHKTKLTYIFASQEITCQMTLFVHARSPLRGVNSATLLDSESEIVLNGPGLILITSSDIYDENLDLSLLQPSFMVSGKLLPSGAEVPATFECMVVETRPRAWEYKGPIEF